MFLNHPVTEKTHAGIIAALVLAVLALVFVALQAAKAPLPVAKDAAPAAFSAQRAFADVKRIARQPHSLATAANAEVRDFLLAQLKGQGLEPQVHTTMVHTADNGRVRLAQVHNIVARMSGSAPDHASRPALMLCAHYDSALTSPGAGDDAASVAAILETLRALRSEPALQNDLIILLSDGEQAGALGALGFVTDHPWAKQVGLVLNFEGGGHGPLLLLESGALNDAQVAGWAKSVPRPLGSSLMVALFAQHDTGMTVFKDAGIKALSFASIEGPIDRNSALDTPERLDLGTLRHIGDTMLGLTRHFGKQRLAGDSGSAQVFFDLPGLGVVHYSTDWVWPLTILAWLAFGGVSMLAVRRGKLVPYRIVQGALCFVPITIGMALTVWALWQCVRLIHPEYALIVQGTVYNAHWYGLALVALATALFMVSEHLVQRRIGVPGAALGAVLAVLIVLVLASVWMPGAAYVLAWPVLAVLLSYALLYSHRVARLPHSWRVSLLLLGAAPGIIMIAPVVRALFIVMTPEGTIAYIGMLALLLGLSTGLLSAIAGRFVVPGLALLACLAFVVQGGLSGSFSAEQPRPNRITYFKDKGSDQAYWIMPDAKLDSWTRNFFKGQTARRTLSTVLGMNAFHWVAAAPEFDIATPQAKLLADDTMNGVRHIELSVKSLNGAPEMDVWLEDMVPMRSSMDGVFLTTKPRGTWFLSAYGMADKEFRLAFDVLPNKQFTIRLRERIPGLPPHSLPARPVGMTPMATTDSETTLSQSAFDIR